MYEVKRKRNAESCLQWVNTGPHEAHAVLSLYKGMLQNSVNMIMFQERRGILILRSCTSLRPYVKRSRSLRYVISLRAELYCTKYETVELSQRMNGYGLDDRGSVRRRERDYSLRYHAHT